MKKRQTMTTLFIESICLLLVLTHAGFVIIKYPQLPDKIINHYNIYGVADGMGHKQNIITLLILNVIMYILFN
jgi:uncharacterized membrane protein